MSLSGCNKPPPPGEFSPAPFQGIGGIPHTSTAVTLVSQHAAWLWMTPWARPAHLTAVAWPVSDRSDTIVSSFFWLLSAACWSRCASRHQVMWVRVPRLTDCCSVWEAFPFVTIEPVPFQVFQVFTFSEWTLQGFLLCVFFFFLYLISDRINLDSLRLLK